MAFTYTTRADGRLMKRVSINGKMQSIYSYDVKDLEVSNYSLHDSFNEKFKFTYFYNSLEN